MNGIHDMGGMHNMGTVWIEPDEPVFHHAWEGRVVGMLRAVQATGRVKQALRPAIESIPPADYLRMSYYEMRFVALIERLVASGLVTRSEVESGRPDPGSARSVPSLAPADAAVLPFKIPPARREAAVDPRFQRGQVIRARDINPATHTRLPRYVRGRTGRIDLVRGVFAFPDTAVYGKGEHPQHVYSVRFAARDLWGDKAASQDAIYLDLWEDYLEPA